MLVLGIVIGFTACYLWIKAMDRWIDPLAK